MNIQTFRAFKNRNYALFFTGQTISQIGTWMQRTGVVWLMYTMTDSTWMVSLTAVATYAPTFFLSLLGGTLADRYDRYKILLITQTASMLQAILLAILVFTHNYVAWQILALTSLLAIINAFDIPARQPMVHQMVENKEDIPNAVALNSAMVNLARIAGPALSGIVYALYGAGVCFLLNALSFVAVITSLLLMKLPKHVPSALKKDALKEISEGFVYLKKTPAIGVIILMFSIVCFFVMSYETLLPAFAKVVFKGDVATFGYVRSFIGMGAICGTFFLASLKPGADLKIILLVNTIILGLGLIVFSFTTYFPLAMFFAAIFGFGAMSQSTICLTIIQVHSDPNMRGRVMGYVAMALFGMLPAGILVAGFLSKHVSEPIILFCQGIMSIVIAIAFSKFLRSDRLSKKEKIQFEETEGEKIDNI
jgi:MFS family permease